MANVTAFIRTTKKKTKTVNVRFRLRDGRAVQLFHSSEIRVAPELWDSEKQQIKARVVCDVNTRVKLDADVSERKRLMLEIYAECKDRKAVSSAWMDSQIAKRLNPDTCFEGGADFFGSVIIFLRERRLAPLREAHYMVLYRALKRFELFKQKVDTAFELSYGTIEAGTLFEIERFLLDEKGVFLRYPDIYAAVAESRKPEPRGQNTVSGMLSKLRTVFIWAVERGYVRSSPFSKFAISAEIYGTPFYISVEERNKIYGTDLRRHPSLAVQRDIFVFHCMVGCRVGDLLGLKRSSVIEGAVEYIASKTKGGHPETIRVPLNSVALEVLGRYSEGKGQSLLPFISAQKYNDAIKLIFKAAGMKRLVTVLNPTTRQEQKRPLFEIASSHIARRSFIGNLYKKVKDPNLVGKLSGHVEGSKAFARYRTIDEEMKVELVKLLE